VAENSTKAHAQNMILKYEYFVHRCWMC